MNPLLIRKTLLASSIVLSLGAPAANAVLVTNVFGPYDWSTDRANFTMLSAGSGIVGGTNDVAMVWDGNAYTASSDYTGPGSGANVTASSTTAFFGYTWAAHDIQVFAPGSYSFDVTLGGGATETGALNVTVGLGQIGMHMLFDWASSSNIDVFIVVNKDSVFGSGVGTKVVGSPCTSTTLNCLWTGKGYAGGNAANAPAGNKVWMLASVDGNGDSKMGIPMPAGGPFAGFNANFNFSFSSIDAVTLTPGTVCNPTDDTQPDPFDFPDVTGAAAGSVNTSDPITVSGLTDLDGGGVSAPISVAGGEYSKDGGSTWTSATGTVVNDDTVRVRQTASANEDGTRTDTLLNIGGVVGTYSVTVIDKEPVAPSFTSQTDVATNTLLVSDTYTVTGMDSGLTTPISISGGEYSKDGGVTWASTDDTVQLNDTVKVRQLSSANGATTTIATLTLGAAGNGTLVSGTFSVRTAGGLSSTGNNFTMLDKTGGVTGGTNDVVMDWDQQFNTLETDPVTPATAHMHLSSVTSFFGFTWTAHHIRVFGPGTYIINTDNTECTVPMLETTGCTPSTTASKNYTFTVGANQVGAHMLFDWNTTKNIDVVDIWNQSAIFSPSQLYTGEVGCANTAQVWDYMSGDWDNDAQNGAKMIDGPFSGFSANFNLRTTTAALACSAYTPTVNVSSPSGAGGCSISPTPTHLLARGDWWLVAGFLAWLGGIQMRLKRKTRS